jgi:hypothetical protein
MKRSLFKIIYNDENEENENDEFDDEEMERIYNEYVSISKEKTQV